MPKGKNNAVEFNLETNHNEVLGAGIPILIPVADILDHPEFAKIEIGGMKAGHETRSKDHP